MTNSATGSVGNSGTLTNNHTVYNNGEIAGTGTYSGGMVLDADYLGQQTSSQHNTAINTALHEYLPSASYNPVEGQNDQKVLYAYYSAPQNSYALVENVVEIGSHIYKWVAITNGTGHTFYALAENINYFEYFATESDATEAGFTNLAEANAVKQAMNSAVTSNGFNMVFNLYVADSELTAANYRTAGTLVSSRTVHCED